MKRLLGREEFSRVEKCCAVHSLDLKCIRATTHSFAPSLPHTYAYFGESLTKFTREFFPYHMSLPVALGCHSSLVPSLALWNIIAIIKSFCAEFSIPLTCILRMLKWVRCIQVDGLVNGPRRLLLPGVGNTHTHTHTHTQT